MTSGGVLYLPFSEIPLPRPQPETPTDSPCSIFSLPVRGRCKQIIDSPITAKSGLNVGVSAGDNYDVADAEFDRQRARLDTVIIIQTTYKTDHVDTENTRPQRLPTVFRRYEYKKRHR